MNNLATSNETLLVLSNGPLVQQRGDEPLVESSGKTKEGEILKPEASTSPPASKEPEKEKSLEESAKEEDKVALTAPPELEPAPSSAGESVQFNEKVSDDDNLVKDERLTETTELAPVVANVTPVVLSSPSEDDKIDNIENPPPALDDTLVASKPEDAVDVAEPPVAEPPTNEDASSGDANTCGSSGEKEDGGGGVQRHNSAAKIIILETKEIINETVEHLVEWMKDKLHNNNKGRGTLTAEEQATAEEFKKIIAQEGNDSWGKDIIAFELPPNVTAEALKAADNVSTNEDETNSQGDAPTAPTPVDEGVSSSDEAQLLLNGGGETTTFDNVMPAVVCLDAPSTLDESTNDAAPQPLVGQVDNVSTSVLALDQTNTLDNADVAMMAESRPEGEDIVVKDTIDDVLVVVETQETVASSVDRDIQLASLPETESSVICDAKAVDLPLPSDAAEVESPIGEEELQQSTLKESQTVTPSSVDNVAQQQDAVDMQSSSVVDNDGMTDSTVLVTHDQSSKADDTDPPEEIGNETQEGTISALMETTAQQPTEKDVLVEMTDAPVTSSCAAPQTTVNEEDVAGGEKHETQATNPNIEDSEQTTSEYVPATTVNGEEVADEEQHETQANIANIEDSEQTTIEYVPAEKTEDDSTSSTSNNVEIQSIAEPKTEQSDTNDGEVQIPIGSTALPTEPDGSAHEAFTAERKEDYVKKCDAERNVGSPKEPEWAKPKLRGTKSGESLRQCGEAPLTRPWKKNMCSDVNVEANQMVLKSTGLGSTLRRGGDIIKPISRDHMSDINFEANPALALRETDTGKSIKEGKCLQKPITKVKKSAAADVNFDANPAILLRSTETGKVAKEKGNLQKPITKIARDETAHINVEANPMILRPTDKGAAVRLGGDIIKPVVRDPMADINFEANPTFVLRESETGKSIKEGRSLQKPITNVEKSAGAHVNFDANPAILLRSTETGKVAKEKGNLQKPITKIPKDETAHINAEANPMMLRPTDKGAAVRLGGDLVKPLVRDPMAGINFEANPVFALRETETGKNIKEGHSLQKPITIIEKSAAADVNFDANPAILLRSTETGKLAKEKGDLQKPITKIAKAATAHINAEANPMMLRPTDKGASVRLGGDLVKPVTRDPMADVNFEANPTFALRETETGKSIKNGRCLQKPITNVEKPAANGVNFEANPALLLRSTETGKVAKETGDLRKVVTKDASSGINIEANPMMLHRTGKGASVRLGEDLVKPVTRDPMADVNFEANPCVLRETETGKSIKEGHCLQKPITNVEKSLAADFNFDANPSIVLRCTEMGKVAKETGDLQKPITCIKDEAAHINAEANAMILRPTDKRSEVRLDGDLAKPVSGTPSELEDMVNDDDKNESELSTETGSS